MAEDWSVCFKIYGTESVLAPYRYFTTVYCFTVTQEYQMQIIQNKRWMVCVLKVNGFVCQGSALLTGSDSLQLWSKVGEVEDKAEGENKTIIHDCSSTWSCVWQSK